MSGHSKWSTIKRQKGANDHKRGQIFTKMANAIIVEVRNSGNGDITQNFKLRLLVDKARSVNMPKDNIERAIERGVGKGDKQDFDEVVYEGFAPGGVSFIAEAVTDNKQRTTPEVKNMIEKNGGTLGSVGSVAYQFITKGMIHVLKSGKTLDDIFLNACDLGAEDVEDSEDSVVVYTAVEDLRKVRDGLATLGLQIQDAGLFRKPTVSVTIADKETAQKTIAFLEKLEDMDDIQKVYANVIIPDTLL